MSGFINALPGTVTMGLIWGIMAIGVFITYKVLELSDLTVDGSFCTGGAVCAVLIAAGHNFWFAMLVAVLAGMLTGLVTGLLHTKCGIPAILAGILTQLGLWSVNLAIMGMRSNQALNPGKQQLLLSMRYLTECVEGVRPFYMYPMLIVGIVTAVIIGILYWFFGTELGASIRATGANGHMARAQGINTDRNKVLGFVVANGLVALSGALLCQYNGFAESNMGRGAIVIGLAAIIIGEVAFGKIFRNFALRLLGVSLGAVIYYVVVQAVISLMDIDSNYLKLISAAIVALFLAVPYWKQQVHLTRKPGKEGNHA